MDRAEQLAALSGPAADQWGLITSAQAKKLGLNAVQLLRLTEAGLLENVSRSVYLLSASGMPRHADIKAAWLRLQPKTFAWDRPVGHLDSGVVSHASSCQLHTLGDIPAPNVEITVPRRRTTAEPFVRLRTANLEPAEVTIVDGLPVTTATRTITDLLQTKADGGHIGGVIADANRRDLIDLDDLAERVQPYVRKYGLKATATGRDLISHLVEQAGESLHHQEVARASKEGFDAAVHLLAEHPDLAAYLAGQAAGQQGKVRNAISTQDLPDPSANVARALANYANTGELGGLRSALEDINLQLTHPDLHQAIRGINQRLPQPDPGLTKMIREINRRLPQPDPGIAKAIRRINQRLPQPDPGLTKAIREINRRLPQPDPGIAKAIREINRQLARPNAALTAALKLPQPDPGIAKAIRDAVARPLPERKAPKKTTDTTTPQRPALPVGPTSTPHSSPSDSQPTAETD
ncbi:type IV toxin-antitoxin system AbiEi family antitoxin domain-containing protein [Streptomyces asoensis]|uniref:type IV toxin-antitoxin system AbiEi family antitoxin domain-containing protein n=1 Tax=Streptomyces asoensis TaxID=249586 RepID=UPI0033F34725